MIPEPIPHWPGELVRLGDHQVFVRSGPDGSSGEPALFVHGLEGSSRNWTDLIALLPRLSGQAVDLPGFGDSPPRPDGRFSIAALAQTVTALLARRGIPARLVIGARTTPAFLAHAWVECDGVAVLDPGDGSFARLVEL